MAVTIEVSADKVSLIEDDREARGIDDASDSALEDTAITALRKLNGIPDDAEAVFDIIAIMGMIEMIFSLIQQCQESQGRIRRGRKRQAADMLAAARNPSRRVSFGAYRTARKEGNSRRESIDLVEAWIETAQKTTVESVEEMIDEVENPLVA